LSRLNFPPKKSLKPKAVSLSSKKYDAKADENRMMENAVRGKSLYHRNLWSVFALVLFGLLTPTVGQHRPAISMEISHVALVNEAISIDYEVSAFEKTFLVGACKGSEGRKNLCDVSLEVHSPNGWKAVGTRHCGCKLGFPFPETWDIQPVPAGETGHFHFIISKISFAMESGQRLRLVAHAWIDEQSLRHQKHGIKLTTKPFACP